jgi:hypothetical protein
VLEAEEGWKRRERSGMSRENNRLEIRLSDFLLSFLIAVVVAQTLIQVYGTSRIAERLTDLSARIERLIKVTEGVQ